MVPSQVLKCWKDRVRVASHQQDLTRWLAFIHFLSSTRSSNLPSKRHTLSRWHTHKPHEAATACERYFHRKTIEAAQRSVLYSDGLLNTFKADAAGAFTQNIPPISPNRSQRCGIYSTLAIS